MKVGMCGVSFLKILAPFFFAFVVIAKEPPLDPASCITFAKETLKKNSPIDALFFTPDEAKTIKQLLIGLIESEQKSIKMALFRLTDKDITQALIRAKERGISVEVVVDSGALSIAYYSKVHQLAGVYIPVYVYQSMTLREDASYKSIMHQKTFLFEDALGCGPVVVFGSLNPTHAAFNGNEESVQIRDNPIIIQRFKDHFEKLKKRSHCYSITDAKKQKKKKKSLKKKRVKSAAKKIGQDMALHYHDSLLAVIESTLFV